MGDVKRDPMVLAAVAKSPLRALSASQLEKFFAQSRLLDVPPGGMPQGQSEERATPALHVSGILRAFHTNADGRQVTVRYPKPGSLMAFASLHMKHSGIVGQQAVTDCRVVRFSPDALMGLLRTDIVVANLIAEENARRLYNYIDELTGNTFGTMRQRLVRHLIDLAAPLEDEPRRLVARVSQQALADAVGSVREVVVRLLRDLREASLIKTGRDEIEVLAPDRLLAEMYERDG